MSGKTTIIDSISALRGQVAQWRKQDLRVGFVPTMGFLHQGHLSLIHKAKAHTDRVIVSIFVNPTQFAPGEDLDCYPRDLEGDHEKVQQAGGDVIFFPSVEDMYPKDAQTFVEVKEVTKPLCGSSRPIHFRGVATIVTKLFNIVTPDLAVFGKKDFQQLVTIQRMVADLHMDIEILGGDIIREEDGLALSSRNVYLSPEERTQANCLNRALRLVRQQFASGNIDSIELVSAAKKLIQEQPLGQLDYAELRDANTLLQVGSEEVNRTAIGTDRLFLAVHFGKTRLIDNAPLEGPCSLDTIE